MKRIALDTNVLVSFLTDRNLVQQEKAAEIFSRAAGLKAEILCQQEVISEFIYVMDSVYRVKKSLICDLLCDFIAMPGVEIVSDLDFALVTRLWPGRISDYGDAVIASLCKATRGCVVATFDRKFINELKAVGIAVMA